jgi:hypothetical protein
LATASGAPRRFFAWPATANWQKSGASLISKLCSEEALSDPDSRHAEFPGAFFRKQGQFFGSNRMLATQIAPFVEFLRSRLGLSEDELPEPGEWADAGNTIGMLALRMGLLTVEQIDHILETQEQEGNSRRFGELAESLGLLSHSQVSRLLAVQSLNRELEMGERLVLSGRLEVKELVRHLADFVNNASASAR